MIAYASRMRNLLLSFHLASAIHWLCSMRSLLPALRPPATAALHSAERQKLLVSVLRRFCWTRGVSPEEGRGMSAIAPCGPQPRPCSSGAEAP
ncbi:hypothetical protein WG922_05590 [Ramlibacter sp. AN1015]|uniref:hypothetical protein n=1 Tax=Ramlibacter sp. AN1015 TaxID=3133428 RepID=UPI0030C37834